MRINNRIPKPETLPETRSKLSVPPGAAMRDAGCRNRDVGYAVDGAGFRIIHAGNVFPQFLAASQTQGGKLDAALSAPDVSRRSLAERRRKATSHRVRGRKANAPEHQKNG